MSDEKSVDLLRFSNNPSLKPADYKAEADPISRELKKAAEYAGMDPDEILTKIQDTHKEYWEKFKRLNKIRQDKQKRWDHFDKEVRHELKEEDQVRWVLDNGLASEITAEELKLLNDYECKDRDPRYSEPRSMTVVPAQSPQYISSAENAYYQDMKPLIAKGLYGDAIKDPKAGFQKCLQEALAALNLSSEYRDGRIKMRHEYNENTDQGNIYINDSAQPYSTDPNSVYKFHGYNPDPRGNGACITFTHKNFPDIDLLFRTDTSGQVIGITETNLTRYKFDFEDGSLPWYFDPEIFAQALNSERKVIKREFKAIIVKDGEQIVPSTPEPYRLLMTPEGTKFIKREQIRVIRIDGILSTIKNIDGDPVSTSIIELYNTGMAIRDAMDMSNNGKNNVFRQQTLLTFVPKLEYADEIDDICDLFDRIEDDCSLPRGTLQIELMIESYAMLLNAPQATVKLAQRGRLGGANRGKFDFAASTYLTRNYRGAFKYNINDAEFMKQYKTYISELMHQANCDGMHGNGGNNGDGMYAEYGNLHGSMLSSKNLEDGNANDQWSALPISAAASNWASGLKSEQQLNGQFKRKTPDKFMEYQRTMIKSFVQLPGMLLSEQERQDKQALANDIENIIDVTMQAFNEMFTKHRGACSVIIDSKKMMSDSAIQRIQEIIQNWLSNVDILAISQDEVELLVHVYIQQNMAKHDYPAEVAEATKMLLIDEKWFHQARMELQGCPEFLIAEFDRQYHARLSSGIQKKIVQSDQVTTQPSMCRVSSQGMYAAKSASVVTPITQPPLDDLDQNYAEMQSAAFYS